jgi:signal transduction histidine kinase/CheY-like chemotaxis protein
MDQRQKLGSAADEGPPPVEVLPSRNRRSHYRTPIGLPAQLELEDGRILRGVTEDISRGGLRMRISAPLPQDTRLRVRLSFCTAPFELTSEAVVTRGHDGPDNAPRSIALRFVDLDEWGQERLVAAVQQHWIQAERLHALGQMAGGVAHDLNNMLAAILGHTQLALGEPAGAAGLRQRLAVIEKVALDAARVVQRIQDFNRSRPKRPFAPVDLRQLIAEVVELARPHWVDTAQCAGGPIRIQLETGEIPPIQADGAELREVLLNLIVNAVQAMPGGGTLTLRAGAMSDQVWFSVGDTGVGMTPTVQARVFEPFFTTKGEQGTGLGLSVSFGIIRRHGGQIHVQSAPGQGTTVTVLLPRAPVEEAAAPTVAAPRPDPAAPRPSPATLLLVDDHSVVRSMLRDILAGAGYTVIDEASPGGALERARQQAFDLALTDLSMPEMRGTELARQLKEIQPGMRVLLITGWVAEGEAIPPPSYLDGVLAKPISIQALLEAVASALARPARNGSTTPDPTATPTEPHGSSTGSPPSSSATASMTPPACAGHSNG